jgi:M6 family metalloprotease-like protein
MNVFIALLISFCVLPVFAGQNSTDLSNFEGQPRFLNYDKESYLKRSNENKTHIGESLEYIVDYGPEDKKHHSESRFFFHDDDGHFYKLNKDAVIKRSNLKTLLHDANSNQATGVQRTLVVPVGDLEASARSRIYTQTFLESAFFSNTESSLNTYYKEVSVNKTSFSGEFAKLFIINGLCEGGNIFNTRAADFLIDSVDQSVDLSEFDRLSFIFPDDNACLGGALGVASVGNISYNNSFGKPTRISFNFNKSAGATIDNSAYFLKVITHEFGHNFGLRHDNANACGEAIFQAACPSLEYGGVHSIMGYSPNLAHVNAIHQYDLKWLTDAQVETIVDDGTQVELTLKALASKNNSGLKAIRIKRTDGSFYTVEYRSPVGMELEQYATEKLSYGGLQIYLNDESQEKDSILLRKDFKVFDIKDNSQAFEMLSQGSFTPNDVFYDPISDIRITPISVNSNEARVLVEKAFVSGGATTEADDPYVHQSDALNLKAKGITKVKGLLVYNGDALTNAKIIITIPKAYKKFIKVKKKPIRLDENLASVNFKFAPLKRFEKKLITNESGQYAVDLKVKVIDKITKAVIYQGVSNIFLDPSQL